LFGQLERLDRVVHAFMTSVKQNKPGPAEGLESEESQRLRRMLDYTPMVHGPVLGPPVLCGASPAIGLECLMGFLGTMRKTGVVRARADETAYMISVVGGDVVHGVCDPRPESELLGSLLLARGAIGSEALMRFIETCGSSPSRIVDALNGEELVSTAVLREVLALQMQMLVDRLLASKRAEWCFHEGEATLCYVNLRVNVNRMLIESARSHDQNGAQPAQPAVLALPGQPAESALPAQSDEPEAEKKPLQMQRPGVKPRRGANGAVAKTRRRTGRRGST
jgi:hypothetical protein